MTAVLVNSLAIFVGGWIGLAFRKILKQELLREVLKAVGLSVIIFGLLGTVREMIYLEEGTLKSRNELLLLISLTLGLFLGECLKLDFRIKAFGNYLEKKFNAKSFSQAFITSTIVFATGAMAIVGSIRAGLGDPNMLYLKATIDGITAILLASVLGGGVLFSALSLFLYQGLIAFLAIAFGNFLSKEFISAFSAIGYVILIAIGIDFIFKDKIKPINMTPALGICILYFLIKMIF